MMKIEKEHFTAEGEEDSVRFVITTGGEDKTVFLDFQDVSDLSFCLNVWMMKRGVLEGLKNAQRP